MAPRLGTSRRHPPFIGWSISASRARAAAPGSSGATRPGSAPAAGSSSAAARARRATAPP